jgi:serine/threonine-protein kinase
VPFHGLVLPEQVAVDDVGDVFSFTGYANGNPGSTVFEVPKTTTGYGAQISIPLSAPISALSLDRHGDIFAIIRVTNMQDSVVEVHRTASGYDTATQVATLTGYWPALAVDSSGDLFAAQLATNSSVVELPVTGAGYGAPVVLPFQGLCVTWGVAVDRSGDVFASSDCQGQEDGQVLELPATAQGYGAQATLPFQPPFSPSGLAIGGDGSVFVGDGGNHQVVVLPRTPSGYGPQQVVGFSGLDNPQGVAVDSMGTVLAADANHNRVVAVHPGGTQAPPPGSYVCQASGTYEATADGMAGPGASASYLNGTGTCTTAAASFDFSFTSSVHQFVGSESINSGGTCYLAPMPVWDNLGVTLSGPAVVYEFGQIWKMSPSTSAYSGTVTPYYASSPNGAVNAVLSGQPTCSMDRGIVDETYPLSFGVTFRY